MENILKECKEVVPNVTFSTFVCIPPQDLLPIRHCENLLVDGGTKAYKSSPQNSQGKGNSNLCICSFILSATEPLLDSLHLYFDYRQEQASLIDTALCNFCICQQLSLCSTHYISTLIIDKNRLPSLTLHYVTFVFVNNWAFAQLITSLHLSTTEPLLNSLHLYFDYRQEQASLIDTALCNFCIFVNNWAFAQLITSLLWL